MPRVTFLASGRSGWAAICRMVSETHLHGERGRPVATLDLLAPHLGNGDVMVLLGPTSELGVAAVRRRDDLGLAALASWLEVVPRDNLVVELVSHRLPGGGSGGGGWGPGTSPHAARMAGVAHRAGLGTVLSNAVRYADRLDAPTVDVLDAARRLVALDRRHVDRANAEGFLKSGKQMHEVAEEVCRLAGLAHDSDTEARRLLARTRAVADRCALDPRSDLGTGRGALPRVRPGGGAGGVGARRAAGPLRGRHRPPLRPGAPAAHLEAPRRRARADPRARLRLLLPHRRRHHRPDRRDGGAPGRPRLGCGQPRQLPPRRLRGRPDPPRPADGAVPVPAARVAARHRHRRRVRPTARGLRGDPRALRRRSLRVRLDDGHLPRPARRPRRRRRAGHAARRGRRDRQGVPAHPGARRPHRDARPPRAARQRPGQRAPRPDVPAGRAPRRTAPAHRRPPVRGAALRRHPARPARRSRRPTPGSR